MKKNKTIFFTKILFSLFTLATIFSLFIVYTDSDHPLSFHFLTGYVCLTFFLLIYVPFMTFMNARKYSWSDLRKRFVKFVALLLLFIALTSLFDLVIKSSKVDLLKSFSSGLGIAFSLTFLDILFSKEKSKRNKYN
ncbi:hypothetical protein SAMN04488700_0834 [Carnobacterium iners]|uniref:Uncharacterized protein n=1 Tax=Carnobacterium iners TaxID=1073423 RepID=A0A1X7MTP0_9LACT|nr:hypothetical protein [Carnobacterium iners]SEK57764.1 hypothetical protein SAMN04488114_10672 [Carnobacterium iners]SMH28095.1 hypothetical protein SAMN04488700_0834 [Carnobacterium iners]